MEVAVDDFDDFGCDSVSAVAVPARVCSVRRGEFKSCMPIWDIVRRDASATEQNHI